MGQLLDCIDAGSEYCPCHLAETGDCIMCSQLQGKTFCDCKSWKGVCIYQEYIWNGSRVKEGRCDCVCQVLHKELISNHVLVLTLKVTKMLARELKEPGSYVFVRDEKDPHYFDAPMSILSADDEAGTVEMAIQLRGVKTKALQDIGAHLNVRGPYWNGLLGLKYIKGLRNGRALLITRGIGQVPAVAIAAKLISAGNQVTVILDKGRAGTNVGSKYFQELGCHMMTMSVFDHDMRCITPTAWQYLEKVLSEDTFDLIYSGGSDKMHQGISQLIRKSAREVFFTCSNDARLCCGEGICGSCHTRLKDGTRIRSCKTQIVPVEIY